MNDDKTKELQVKVKAELTGQTENTKTGLTFTPDGDIFETETNITILAEMPGVKADDLSIDLRENVLTLEGDVENQTKPDEVEIIKEYRTGKYYRQFSLSELIDQSKIDAELKDGVLRLTLPKAEAAQPRKISVRNG